MGWEEGSSSKPGVLALYRHLLTLGGHAGWRQGQDQMRQGDAEPQVLMPALSPIRYVTWDKAPSLSEPQCSHL